MPFTLTKSLMTTIVFGPLASAASMLTFAERADAYNAWSEPAIHGCSNTGMVLVTSAALGSSGARDETVHRLFWVYSFDGTRWSRTDTSWQQLNIQGGDRVLIDPHQTLWAAPGTHYAVYEWRAQWNGSDWVFDGGWAKQHTFGQESIICTA